MPKKVALIFLLVAALSLVAVGCAKRSPEKPGGNSQVPESGDISYAGQNGRTALDLLRSKYRVETRAVGSSEVVVSISGRQPGAGQVWSFTVNGAQAPLPADRYVTKTGDTIRWELKAVNKDL